MDLGGGGSANLGTLYTTLGVDTKQLGQASVHVRGFSKNASRQFSVVTAQAKNVATALGVIGVAVTAIAAKAAVEAAKFETALVDMGKVTNQNIGSMRKDILGMSAELGSSTELMRGYYQTISAGVTDPVQALGTLTTAAQAARAAHVSQSDMIKSLTKVMTGYSGELRDAADAADLLFAIEKQGQTSVQELVPVIGALAAQSQVVGVSVNEMGGALAYATQIFGSTAEAATAYQGILAAIQKPQETLVAAVDELGFASARAMVSQIGLGETIQKLSQYAKDSGVEFGKMFEERAGGLLAEKMLGDEFRTVGENMQVMADRAGRAMKAFDAWRETAAAIFETFKNTVNKELILLGEKILPDVKTGMKDLTEYIANNREALAASFVSIAGAVGVLAKAFLEVAKFGATSIDIIDKASKQMGGGVTAVAKDIGDESTTLLNEKKLSELSAQRTRLMGFVETQEEVRSKLVARLAALPQGSGLAEYLTEDLRSAEAAVQSTYAKILSIQTQIEVIQKTQQAIVVGASDSAAEARRGAAASAGMFGEQSAASMSAWVEAAAKKRVVVEKATAKERIEVAEKEGRAVSRALYGPQSAAAMQEFIDEGSAEYEKKIDEEKRLAEQSAEARILATRNMYSDMRGESGRYYAFQKGLLDEQYREYAALVDDKALLDQWYNSQLQKLSIEAARYSDDFMAGVRAGLLDLEDSFVTFGEAGYDVVVDFAKSASSALSDYFFDVIKGEVADISDLFSALGNSIARSLSDSLASMAVGSITDGIGRLLGGSGGLGSSIASLFGGGSTGAGAAGVGFTEGGSAVLTGSGGGAGAWASSIYSMAAPAALAAGAYGYINEVREGNTLGTILPPLGAFQGLGKALGLWGDDYVESSQSYGDVAFNYAPGQGLASNVNLSASYAGDYESGGIAVAQTNNAMQRYANDINAIIAEIVGALPADVASQVESTIANTLFYQPPQVNLNVEGTGPWNAGNLNQIAYAMDQTLRSQLITALNSTIGYTLEAAGGSIVEQYKDALSGSNLLAQFEALSGGSLLSEAPRAVLTDINEFALVWGEIQAALSDTVGDVSAIQDELLAVNEQFNAYRDAVSDFSLSAETLAQIEAARSEEFLGVLEQAASSYRDAWQGFMDGLMFSDLAPVQSAEGVVGRYEELLAVAKGGDLSAYQDLLSFVQGTYLPFAQAYGGADYNDVYSSLVGASGELTNLGVDMGGVTNDALATSISAALAPYLENQDGELRIVLQIGTETFDDILIDRLSGSTQVVDAVTGIVRSVN